MDTIWRVLPNSEGQGQDRQAERGVDGAGGYLENWFRSLGHKQSDTLPSRNSIIQKLTLTNTTDRVVERRSGPLNVCCL